MSSDPGKHGVCPLPFFQEKYFPAVGGYIGGRYCENIGDISCCMPCPLPDWKFPTGYRESAKIANWLAVAFFTLNALILISYVVLPVKVTHRNYLNVGLILGIMSMAFSFIIALGAQPDECFDEITPHDMKSDLSCAFSGAFILLGGWAVVIWSFCRTLSLHLQICWDVVPGKKFFYSTLIIGWIVPFVMIAVALSLTGVSYRFGSICHINHERGLEDFWGPLMAIAAASLILHFGTLAYCIHIYVKSVMDDDPGTEGASTHTPYSGSGGTLTARQTYRRVRSVIKLQWRGIATVLTVLGNVIFFAIIFLRLDASALKTPENREKQLPWVLCLMDTAGDRFACADEAASFGPSKAVTIAVLIMLSVTGLWTVLFLGHFSTLRACYDQIRQKMFRRDEFVSMDARGNGAHSRATYEMYSSNPMKSPEPLLSASPTDMSSSTFYRPYSPAKELDEPSGLARDARYHTPALSFSSPRPPSAARQASFGRDWDPVATFARGDVGSRPYRNHSSSHSRQL